MELDIDQIETILPHRYPFLLVDKIIDCVPGQSAKGIKCVTANEPFFQGHFPGFKVMPGVLIIEALAQVGAVAILTEEGNEGKLALFGGIKNARFKQQVRLGTCWSWSVNSRPGRALWDSGPPWPRSLGRRPAGQSSPSP